MKNYQRLNLLSKKEKGIFVLEFNKKKYTQKEVRDIFLAYKNEYESRFIELSSRISELVSENIRLKAEVEKKDEKESLILSVLKRAEQTALDLEKQANLEYELAFDRLKKFNEKWNSYFEKVKEKYPTSSQVKKAIKIKNKVTELSNSKISAKLACNNLELLIDEQESIKKKFEPKKKLANYISASTNSGFNMDEVLNPGNLELEAICKELGLMDGNE